MRGHAPDRAGAVTEQHIIGDPDWNFLFGRGINRVGAGKKAGLFFCQLRSFEIAFARGLFPIFAHRWPLIFGHDLVDQRMLWREHQECPAIKRVRSRREYADLLFVLVDLEIDLGAFTPADPIALEQFNSLRPIEAFQFIDQSLCVSGDTQHPLPHRSPDDRKAAHFAFSVDHFFVRQDGAELRTPVHRNISNVSEPNFVQIFATKRFNRLGLVRFRIEPRIINLEKNPLRPFEVTRIGGVDFTLPIIGETDPLQLRFEFGNVLAGGDSGMLAALDRVLFCRQAKGVPAHRMENIEPAHPFVTRDNVGGRITFRMSHVQTGAAWIRKHVEHVEFRFGRVEILRARIRRVKNLALVPDRLPLGLNLVERIWFAALAAH